MDDFQFRRILCLANKDERVMVLDAFPPLGGPRRVDVQEVCKCCMLVAAAVSCRLFYKKNSNMKWFHYRLQQHLLLSLPLLCLPESYSGLHTHTLSTFLLFSVFQDMSFQSIKEMCCQEEGIVHCVTVIIHNDLCLNMLHIKFLPI